MSKKIQVGYGSDKREYGKKSNYGGRNNGKKLFNGGFNGNPTVTFENVSQERWDQIFGKKNGV